MDYYENYFYYDEEDYYLSQKQPKYLHWCNYPNFLEDGGNKRYEEMVKWWDFINQEYFSKPG
jgi:hypothetical protein